MRKWFAVLAALVLLTACVLPAAAQDGHVIYKENAKKFIFQPGSDYSPSDLFPNFKDVMPGDSISQTVYLKNHRSNNCKVKIYMRSLGAHPDSWEFLSQLGMTVVKETDTVMFDATAGEEAQLTDWVYLGTLYSGGECELTVTLDVPVTLDNRFKDMIGYLDWEFAVTELPVEDTDPTPPKTGDESRIFLWAVMMAGSMVMLCLFVPGRKKKAKK